MAKVNKEGIYIVGRMRITEIIACSTLNVCAVDDALVSAKAK